MTLTRLKVTNFKCFTEFGTDIPKILLLTGANSSGKSTLINALLAAGQSPQYPFTLSPNGDLVTMGDYSEIVHDHAPEKSISMEMSFSDEHHGDYHINAVFKCNYKTGAPMLQHASISDKNLLLEIERLKVSYRVSFKTFQDSASSFSRNREYMRLVQRFARGISALERKHGKDNETFPLPRPPRTIPTDGTFFARDHSQFKAKMMDLPIRMVMSPVHFGGKEILGNLFTYIGPFRISPERTYYRKAKGDLTVDRYGENAIEQLIDWRTRKSKAFNQFISALKQMELLDELKVQNFKGGRFEVRVVVRPNSVSAALTDVGFGISQFLPVLVADIQTENDGLFIVSQPEIHLHPRTQALYGEYISDRVKSTKRRYILETHSEYLINRLRLKIAKGELEESDVGLIYMDISHGKVKPVKIEMKKTGELVGAPQSFFDTYMMDTMSIAMEASETAQAT